MITVIAGVNGAGKSSIIGSWLRDCGGEYFNPDEAAQRLRNRDSAISLSEANASAWKIGFDQLSQAIDNGEPYTLETTLGGNSITNKFHEAIEEGRQVSIFYCGLASIDLHIARVAARVHRGGHDIPAEEIRRRYESSISNLVTLVPVCHRLFVIDNSAPFRNGKPSPLVLLHLVDDRFSKPPVTDMPDWAKPIAGAALRRVYPDFDSTVPNA